MGEKTKASIYMMLVSIVNSVVMVIFNLIYSNLLIRIYGSEINGLIATLTQFVSMFAIIEGGFTTAAVVATYGPIIKKDFRKLNDILYTTKKIFFKMGIFITICVLVFGGIYINFINSPFSFLDTYLLLIISVITTALSLCFLSKYSILLQGNNKEYIQIIINLLCKLITWILSLILIFFKINIILLFSINILNITLNIFLLKIYEKNNYLFVTYKGIFDKNLIKGRNDVLLQKIANVLFTSTDLVLVSVFVNLASASVYNLYYQVFRAIFTLLSSIAQAPFNSFGQLLKSDQYNDKITIYFNIYKHLILLFSTVLLTITGILVVPFVNVYTKNIKDFNYIYPFLALLFFSQIFSQIINRPYGNFLNLSGNFKMQNTQCLCAVIVNIVVSLAFINYWGIHSIVLGSFAGTLVILVMNIMQVYKKILNESVAKTMIDIIINYIFGLIMIYISNKFLFFPSNYFEFFLLAIFISIIMFTIIIILNLIINKKLTYLVINYIFYKVLKYKLKLK